MSKKTIIERIGESPVRWAEYLDEKYNQVTVQPVLRFKNQYNARQFTPRYEVNNQVSLTSPNQTLSIDEIRTRFAKGLPLADVKKMPQYIGEGNDVAVDDDVLKGVNWDTLDITEKHAIIQDTMVDLKKLNDGIEYSRKKTKMDRDKKRQDFENRINELFEKNSKTE